MRDIEPFDFEFWSRLAKEDPEQFEVMRREVVGGVIDSAPDRLHEKLYSLQWRVNVERDRSSTPLSACLKISKMMWDAVYAERGGMLSVLHHFPVDEEKAKVLPFKIDSLH